MALGLTPILSGALLIALAWGVAFWLMRSQFEAIVEAHMRENANVARALSEHTEQVFVAADRLLQRVKNQMEFDPQGSLDFPRLARESGVAPEVLVQVAFVRHDGLVVHTSMEPDGVPRVHANVADREHFRIPAQAGMEEAFIGHATLGHVSGRWEIPISRRVDRRDGSLMGVIVVSLDPARFARIYEHIDTGRNGTVLLAGLDGNVRTAYFGGDDRRFTLQLGHDAQRAGLLSEESGSYVGRSGLDDITRITSFRRLVNFPLVVAVSTALGDALGTYERHRATYIAVAALFTAVVLVSAFLLSGGLLRLARLTEALREREMQARLANRAKSDFLANISHDLRTPLTSIRGFSELMERRLPDAAHRETAGIIRRAAEHLTRLLNDLLDLTKAEAGAMHLALAPVAIEKMVRDTTELFRGAANAKGLTISLAVEPGIPDSATWDATRVKQILNNLLSNAIKFTEQGGVIVSLSRTDRTARIAVADTGPGIPAHLREAVFQKFGQGDPSLSRAQGGTGLGLTLARTFAEMMGGGVTLEASKGPGSCFVLELPLDAEPVPAPKPRAPQLAASGVAQGS